MTNIVRTNLPQHSCFGRMAGFQVTKIVDEHFIGGLTFPAGYAKDDARNNVVLFGRCDAELGRFACASMLSDRAVLKSISQALADDTRTRGGHVRMMMSLLTYKLGFGVNV